MNITESIDEALKTKSDKNDSQLNVLISKGELSAFKAFAKSHNTNISKLVRAFVRAAIH